MATAPGFSLIELMMVVGFLAIVGSFSVVFGIRAVAIQELDSARDTAMSELSLARDHAMGGSNDSSWGVMFATSSLTTFKGPSFTGRDPVFDRTTTFGSRVTFTGATSVVFLPPDGMVQATGTVLMTNGSVTTSVGVNAIGGIEIH